MPINYPLSTPELNTTSTHMTQKSKDEEIWDVDNYDKNSCKNGHDNDNGVPFNPKKKPVKGSSKKTLSPTTRNFIIGIGISVAIVAAVILTLVKSRGNKRRVRVIDPVPTVAWSGGGDVEMGKIRVSYFLNRCYCCQSQVLSIHFFSYVKLLFLLHSCLICFAQTLAVIAM